MTTDLNALLRRTNAVLFDFDGPVCSVFAGMPAPAIARDLRTYLSERGWPVDIPDDVADDPLEVLRAAVAFGQAAVREADDMLTAAETRAVQVAEPTVGGEASMRASRVSGRVVGVVSNNSAAAVMAYLAHRRLTDVVDGPIVGRSYARPDLMKPNPHPVRLAVDKLGVPPDAVLLVGDSTTDVVAARAVGVSCVGYANRPGKQQRLAGADVILDDMQVLVEALFRRPPPP